MAVLCAVGIGHISSQVLMIEHERMEKVLPWHNTARHSSLPVLSWNSHIIAAILYKTNLYVVHTTLITALISHHCLLRSEGAVTVWSSVGFKQTKAVVGTLRTISKPFQHAQVRDVERSREQIAHLTHKLGENHLRWHTKIYTGIWHFIQSSGDE